MINFSNNKMKVRFAAELFSESVAQALRYAHSQKFEGFESNDVLVTAEFISLHNHLFDVLNSRSAKAKGYKAAICISNFEQVQQLFKQVEDMYNELSVNLSKTNKNGQMVVNQVRILESPRRTGPCGFLACIQVIKALKAAMDSGELEMEFLPTYKANQDHTEIEFSTVRLGNGATINPTPQQFRFRWRAMTMNSGKHVTATGNCKAQDDTVRLNVGKRAHVNVEQSSDTKQVQFLEDDNLLVERILCSSKGCIPSSCKVCSASITVIAGRFVHFFQNKIECFFCMMSITHSVSDPCNKDSICLLTNSSGQEKEGMLTPSGSICSLLYMCETVLRRNLSGLHVDNIEDILLTDVLSQLGSQAIFTSLNQHALDTSDGIDNHFMSLVHVISQKYLRLRIRKVLKDISLSKKNHGSGNYLQRLRILYND